MFLLSVGLMLLPALSLPFRPQVSGPFRPQVSGLGPTRIEGGHCVNRRIGEQSCDETEHLNA